MNMSLLEAMKVNIIVVRIQFPLKLSAADLQIRSVLSQREGITWLDLSGLYHAGLLLVSKSFFEVIFDSENSGRRIFHWSSSTICYTTNRSSTQWDRISWSLDVKWHLVVMYSGCSMYQSIKSGYKLTMSNIWEKM